MKTMESVWQYAKRTRRVNLGLVSLIFHFRKKQKMSPNWLLFLKKSANGHLSLAEGEEKEKPARKESHTSIANDQSPSSPISVVVGVGPGLGHSLVRKLAAAGHRVVAVSRDAEKLTPLINKLNAQGLVVSAYSCDATYEKSVKSLFAHVCSNYGIPNLVVYAVQYFSPGRVVDVEAPAFEEAWRNNCLGGFLIARESSRVMLPAKRGTIVLVGSTSSLLAREDHLNLAVGKFGLRALSNVLAREVWTSGIHVSHLVIDAEIDEGTEGNISRPKANPDHIANVVLSVHQQPSDTWTSELDVRPSQEQFWEHC